MKKMIQEFINGNPKQSVTSDEPIAFGGAAQGEDKATFEVVEDLCLVHVPEAVLDRVLSS